MNRKPTLLIIIAVMPLLLSHSFATGFNALSKTHQSRLGVYALDTGNNYEVQYQAKQRFPMCSTAKLMIVAAILKKSIAVPNLLDQVIHYTKQLTIHSGYAPITKQHIDSGMTIAELCAAAISHSDNAAADLLIKKLGGPAAVTEFARSIGDHSFRLDRWEPALNSAIPDDLRDTSTPAAMGKSLAKLMSGHILDKQQKGLLKTWLVANTTGDDRIRAVVAKNWVVGDKTGTGQYGTTNDIAIIWPQKRHNPIILALYFTQFHKDAVPNNQIIREAASIAIKSLQENQGHF